MQGRKNASVHRFTWGYCSPPLRGSTLCGPPLVDAEFADAEFEGGGGEAEAVGAGGLRRYRRFSGCSGPKGRRRIAPGGAARQRRGTWGCVQMKYTQKSIQSSLEEAARRLFEAHPPSRTKPQVSRCRDAKNASVHRFTWGYCSPPLRGSTLCGPPLVDAEFADAEFEGGGGEAEVVGGAGGAGDFAAGGGQGLLDGFAFTVGEMGGDGVVGRGGLAGGEPAPPVRPPEFRCGRG